MTRFEGVLLELMTVRRWCAALLAAAVGFGAAGYFAGREHLKHELRSELRTAMTAATAELEAAGRKLSDDINRKQQTADERFKRIGGGR